MVGLRPKLLFLVTEDWYFCSHRLPLACAARDAGFDVAVATRVTAHGERIRSAGLRPIPIALRRSSRNPWNELQAIREIAAIYRREKPDIVHHVAMKPVLYGSLAAKIAGVPHTVNALAGMGYVFTSQNASARLLRPWITLAFRFLLRNTRVILQNPDDRGSLLSAGILNESQAVLIRGSGVDTDVFRYTPEPDTGTPLIVLPARMLWDKGVGEFVAAAEMLRKEGVSASFVLAGERDADNPAAISLEQLQQWHAAGTVTWLGKQEDMPALLARSHIVCLPSYREGLPKALLEAASSGRAIVATDVPGCREAVRQGENGLLVPPRDSAGLAHALRQLVEDASLRRRYGRNGRAIAEQEFSVAQVSAETLALYRELLS